jgi:hypothetical protein
LQFIWYSFYTAIFILQSSHVIVEQFWKFLRPLRYIFLKGLWN